MQTRRAELVSLVTCPTVRYHPAIVAQKAATVARMSGGRFRLGLGSGENLNEHVVGRGWPPADVRQEMLEEAVEIIRDLLDGGYVSHRGPHFRVQDARVFTLPDEPPPIYIAAGGPQAAALAGRAGDGLVATEPDADLVGPLRRRGARAVRTWGSWRCRRAGTRRRPWRPHTGTSASPRRAGR